MLHDHLPPSVELSGLPSIGDSHGSVIPARQPRASGKFSVAGTVAVANTVTAPSKLTAATGYPAALCYDLPLLAEHQNSRPPIIDAALAAEGAAVARGMAETARIMRAARLRDMLAAVEEWRRASGPDRAWWRQDALHRLHEWRRLYREPQRAAFQRAVARSRAA